MNRSALGVALFFSLLATAVFSAQPPLHLKVEVAGPRVVLGEPETVTISLTAEGDFQLAKAFGPCDGGLLRVIVANENGGGGVQMASDTPPCPQVNPPPIEAPPYYPKYHCSTEFTYHFWLLPGSYTVQARYHAERQPDAATAPYWTGSLSTDTARFQVDDPQGEDLRALQAFNLSPGKTPVKSYVSFIQRNAQELLKRFPTSIYAGYTLAKKIPNYSDPLCHYPSPAESVRAMRDEGRTQAVFPKDSEQYFLQLETHMQSGHVASSLRTKLYAYYGELLLLRGRFTDSEVAFQEAVKEPAQANDFYIQRAQGFLEALKGKQK